MRVLELEPGTSALGVGTAPVFAGLDPDDWLSATGTATIATASTATNGSSRRSFRS